LPDVEGFIERKAHPDRSSNLALRNLPFVHQQGCGRGFADASAFVFELDADDMIARRKQLIGDNAELVLRLVGIRVGKASFAVLHQQSPATAPAADGRQHATRTTLRNGHLGSDRPRLVLEVWRRSLWDADHSREVDELAKAAGKAGPDGRIGA